MEYYKITLNESANPVNVLNFIEETRRFFELDVLTPIEINDSHITCKLTYSLAEVVRCHEDVKSVTALL